MVFNLIAAMLSLRKFVSAKQLLPYRARLEKILWPQANVFWDNAKMMLYVVHIIRVLVICIDWNTKGQFGLLNLDAAYRFAFEFKLIEANFAIFIVLFCLFGAALNYFLYYFFGNSTARVLQCYRQLNLDNPQAMLDQKLFADIDKVSLKNGLKFARLIWKLLRKDKNILDKIEFRKRLSMFPLLSKENRVTEFLVYLGLEVTMVLLMAMLRKSC